MSAPPSSATPWSLSGKTAIVTGGSRGIGRAISIHLARKGLDKLAITYVSNADGANATLEECRALGVKNVAAIKADLTDPDFASKVVSRALEGLDTKVIDIVVNNAVLADPTKALPIKDTTLDNFQAIMHANVYAPVALSTQAIQHLPAYGGRIINISSVLAHQACPDPTVTYAASKAALHSYTRSFAEMFGKQTKATFNSVVVGLTETDAIKNSRDLVPAAFLEGQIRDTTAADRIGVPEDIAYIVGFLASEEGRWVNGAAVSANGGNKLALAALG